MPNENLANEKPEDRKVVPGWYVFQAGQIKGPLSAPEAFGMRPETANHSERYVSRVGFRKWYPVDQVTPVLKEVEKFAEAAKENAQTLENILNENLLKLNQQKPKQNDVLPSSARTQQVQKKVMRPVAPVIRPIETIAEQMGLPKKPIEAALSLDVLEDSYITLKGRLRLGLMRSAWVAAFVNFTLTLGLSWFWWFHGTFREVTYHTYNSHKHHTMATWWFCFIPGLHILAAKRLADAVREMERQNGYQSTSPGWASILSLVPPFFIFYIQRKILGHWMLHVNFMKKQQQKIAN